MKVFGFLLILSFVFPNCATASKEVSVSLVEKSNFHLDEIPGSSTTPNGFSLSGIAANESPSTTSQQIQASGSRSPSMRQVPAKTSRVIIRTGELEITSSHIRDGLDKAAKMAESMDGFVVTSHHTNDKSTMTIRVPSQRFSEAMERLTKLGRIDRRQESGQDVTAEYVDLTMRLKNAEEVRMRYLALLDKANSVGDAVAVQKELALVTENIERLKGQVNLMQSQSNFSAITLTLVSPLKLGIIGWTFYGLYAGIKWLFVW